MQEPLAQILNGLETILGRTPPELASDVVERGVILTGGGALLPRLTTMITRHTGLPCTVAYGGGPSC